MAACIKTDASQTQTLGQSLNAIKLKQKDLDAEGANFLLPAVLKRHFLWSGAMLCAKSPHQSGEEKGARESCGSAYK